MYQTLITLNHWVYFEPINALCTLNYFSMPSVENWVAHRDRGCQTSCLIFR